MIDLCRLCVLNFKFPERLERPGEVRLRSGFSFPIPDRREKGDCGQWRGNFRNLKDAHPRHSHSSGFSVVFRDGNPVWTQPHIICNVRDLSLYLHLQDSGIGLRDTRKRFLKMRV